MAGEIYLSGLSNSGFDYQAILQKYKELESISIKNLQLQEAQISEKKKALAQIEDKLKAFLDPINTLKSPLTYQTKVAILSDPDIADVNVTTDAIESSYTLTVEQLAKASSWKIGTVNSITDINSAITKSGTLTINYLKNGSSQSLSIDYSGKSLRDIMNEINNSGDLKASIINLGTSDSPNYQLIITSANTGTANAITGIDDSANPGDDSDGIFSEDNTKTYETVSAQDAIIDLNGIQFKSSTNRFDNIITGVSIVAKKTGSSDLNITNNYDTIEKALKDIINDYNDLLDTVKKLTSKGEPLSGESMLLTMVSRFAGIIMDNLAKYGFIESGANGDHGKLSLDTSKLEQFLKNPDSQTILQNFANNFYSYLNNYIDTTKNIEKRFDYKIRYIDKLIEFENKRINEEIKILKNKFVKLEAYMAEMKAIQARIANFAKGLSLPKFSQ